MKMQWKIILLISLGVFAAIYNQYQIDKYLSKKLATHMFTVNNVNPDKYLPGINFSKPVKLYEIREGDRFIQYQIPGAPQGNFYALEGSTPSELGINDMGYDSKLERNVKKEKRIYIAKIDMDVISSYAAAIVDDWSTPEDETQTEGNKLQLFTTCKHCFKEQ
jgi:hypothetical protein